MNTSEHLFKAWALVLAVLLCLLTAGCGLFGKKSIEPPPAETVQSSETIRLMGYEITVTVKATPEEFLPFIAASSKIMPQWMKMGEVPMGENGLPVLGGTTPFNVKGLGIEIKGRLITVKSEPEEIWFLWDNPMLFMVHRWKIKRVKESARITFSVASQLPYGGKLPSLEDVLDYGSKVMFRDIDVVFANVQAHFDPSLKAEELVGPAHTGEIFETFVQSHDVKVRINADQETVKDYVADPANFDVFLQEFRIEEAVLERYERSPLEAVSYCPSIFRFGIIRSNFDLFMIKRKKGKGYQLRIYVVGFGRAGLIEQEIMPEDGASVSSIRALFEIPSALSSSERMDMLQYLANVPQMLKEKALAIKYGIEGPTAAR